MLALSRYLFSCSRDLRIAAPSGNITLSANQYAYLPPDSRARIISAEPSRAVIFEKALSVRGTPRPHPFNGDERAVPGAPLQGDDTLEVRTLFPDDAAYDFAVNTMTYQPGATLPMVESHVMEHGLLMLEGEGIYRLGDHWYPCRRRLYLDGPILSAVVWRTR